MAGGPASPYKGLIPYTDDDAERFFGRDAERQLIASNLMASRLTVVYGASGVGKTSLLRAGVVYDLREATRQRLAAGRRAEFIVVPFASWRDDPLPALLRRIHECSAVAGVAVAGSARPPSGVSLAGELEVWSATTGADLFVILDQFEEYFLYHPGRDSTSFEEELVRAIGRPDLCANFLISIREDALARLDRFKGRIPGLFNNYLRIEHLDLRGARDAIEKPVAWYNRQPGVQSFTIEPQLIDAVLDEVRSGKVIIGEGARGVAKNVADRDRDEARVETPFLQLVMTRLWNDPRTQASNALKLETLRALDGAAQIVQMHMRETLEHLTPAEQDVAASIFRYLVTPSGTKVAHTAADLASFAERPIDDITQVLKRLSASGVHVLRAVAPPADELDGAPRYEIFHDVLSKAILDWRGWQERERAREEHERANEELRVERRRVFWLRVQLAVMAILLVSVGILGAIARRQYLATVRERQRVEQQALLANSLANLSSNPDLSLLLALEAMETGTEEARPQVVDALRRALLVTSRVVSPVFRSSGNASLVAAVQSPDGARVAAGGRDGSLSIWDAVSGDLKASRRESTVPLAGVEFSPDGRYLASIDDQGELRVMDGSSAAVLTRVSAYDGAACCLTFGPGNIVATGGYGKATVWRLGSNHQLERVFDAPQADVSVLAVAFDSDGDRLAVAGQDGSVVIWDGKSGKAVKRFNAPDELHSVRFSPDGTLVAAGGFATTVDVWDVKSGQKRSFRGHHNTIFGIDFSPDGAQLASSSADGTTRIWSVASGENILTLSGHAAPVDHVVYSPDGLRVLTAGWDGTARFWDVSGHAGTINAMAFRRSDSLLATGAKDGTVKLWDARSGNQVRDLGGQAGEIISVDFSGSGVKLAALSTTGIARIWDAASWTVVQTVTVRSHSQADNLPADTDGVYASLNSDGSLLAIGDDKGWVHVQHLATRRWVCQVASRFAEAIGVDFERDGSRLATVGVLNDLMLWDTSKIGTGGDLIRVLNDPVQTHTSHVSVGRFSADGRWFATGSVDRTAKLWDARTMVLAREFKDHRDAVADVAFSQDGSRLATASWDRRVRVFGRDNPVPQLVIGHEYPVSFVAFSPDARIVATATVVDSKPELHLLDETELVKYARSRVARGFTADECRTYLHRDCAEP